MDVEKFLVNQGWKKGQGLRPGAIKTALLVKHRKDNKGLGFNPQASEGWWERMFNGHLQSLGVSESGPVEFSFDEEKRRRETSPLYAAFHSGGLLNGTEKKIDQPEKRKKAKNGRVSKGDSKSKDMKKHSHHKKSKDSNKKSKRKSDSR